MPAFYRDAEKAEQEIAFLKTGGLICSHLAAGRAFCKGIVWWSPGGVAESPEGDSQYACPAGGYFSMKKSNQKSLGEDPETPDASEPPRPETLRIPGAGLDDAYKVLF